MNCYDEQLQELQSKVLRKKFLEKTLDELNSRKAKLEKETGELEKARDKEQRDVERMEGGSLASFFYSIIGKQVERLNKERDEAYAAAVKYDAAVCELNAVNEDIAKYETELKPLRYCEQDYEKVLAEKCEAIKKSGTADGAEILEIEESISKLAIYAEEITVAISAGKKARSIADELVDILDEAKYYARIDINDRSTSVDRKKYACIDEAEEKFQQLQVQLGRFRTELADVEVEVRLDIGIDERLRFMDYFISDYFVDRSVLEKLDKAQCNAQEIRSKIAYANARLSDMLTETEKEQTELAERLKKLIISACL